MKGMLAMQYNINLPADYDMNIIKDRVHKNGFKTDGFNNLELKAYLIAEKEKYDNIQNEYAPFYVWNGVEGMNQFLLGGPFNNILDSFGWTSVNTWQIIHAKVEKSGGTQYATITKTKIQACLNFLEWNEEQQQIYEEQLNHSDTMTSIVAYNPSTWEVCNFLISSNLDYIKGVAGKNQIYDIYHIS